MKIKILRTILIILLIGTGFIIFNFSSQNGEKSGGKSRKITIMITKNIKAVQNLEESEKEQVLNTIEKIIRKTAHFSIYTIVGILLMAEMCTYKLKKINQIGYSLIIGVIYASSDEIHQAFIPGRSAQLTDVILDSIGVLFGILLIYIFVYIIYKQKNIKNEEKGEKNG